MGLHKCDMRLLHLAAKLGPVITEAAQQVAAAMAEQEAAGDDAQEAPEPGRCPVAALALHEHCLFVMHRRLWNQVVIICPAPRVVMHKALWRRRSLELQC